MLNEYKIIKSIGKGSYGLVYLVTNKNNYYAMKKINISKFSKKEKQYLIGEIMIQKLNSSQFIIKLHDLYFENNNIYLISEYAEKGTLHDYIDYCKKNKLKISNKLIATWILQVSMGLYYLHKNNIIHRDLKTENIFLDSNFNIKIGDLGIVKILYNKYFASTQIGTPYYMSPELFKGGIYNYKTDIWSLGCILYELITLQKPFYGNNIIELGNNIQYKKYPINFNNTYKSNYLNLLDKLLYKEYNQRAGILDIINNKFLNSFYTSTINKFEILNLNVIKSLESEINWNRIISKINIKDRYIINSTINNKTIVENSKYNNTNLSLDITPPVRMAPILPLHIKLDNKKCAAKNNYSFLENNVCIDDKFNINSKLPLIKHKLKKKLKNLSELKKKKKEDLNINFLPRISKFNNIENNYLRKNSNEYIKESNIENKYLRKISNEYIKESNIENKYYRKKKKIYLEKISKDSNNKPLHKINRNFYLNNNFIEKNIENIQILSNKNLPNKNVPIRKVSHFKYIKEYKDRYISPYSNI